MHLISSKKNKTVKEPNGICNALKHMMLIAQCFGLLPVGGILNGNYTFKWKSVNVIPTLLILFIASIHLLVFTYHLFLIHTVLFQQVVEYVFNASALVTTVLFLRLAKHWPQLINDWKKVDIIMEKNYGYPDKLTMRLKITSCIMMALAAVEHLLSLSFNAIKATKINNGTLAYKQFYYNTYPQIFDHIPLSIFTSTLIQIVSIVGTVTWNFNDLFIVTISSAISLRFKQVSKRLKYNEKPTDIAYWIEIREDYDRLSNLCRKLDEVIAYLVLNSFATNIFFILVQLFNSLRVITETVEKIYFFYSFGFLILRTVTVSMYAAWINDESKNPIYTLNSLPSKCYNNEVKRFILQISTDTVALTGCRIFKVTRGLILSVAGAIVTYELVLIQFNTTALHK